jgi:hypothetical protein
MESHFTTRAAKQPSQTHDQHLTCLTYFNPSLLHSIIVAWEDTLRESYDALQVSFIITFDTTPAGDAWSTPVQSGTPSSLSSSSNASSGPSAKRNHNSLPSKLFLSDQTTAATSVSSDNAEAIQLEKEIKERQEQLAKLKRDSLTKPRSNGKK